LINVDKPLVKKYAISYNHNTLFSFITITDKKIDEEINIERSRCDVEIDASCNIKNSAVEEVRETEVNIGNITIYFKW
jgi:hypothetical protein